ncbi:hypothetical protein JI57_01925 [Psychromonas sp. PRT-SC03]|nr:hypothetical protein JI57_01925 [Psychromonas sp. PRT-SC03]
MPFFIYMFSLVFLSCNVYASSTSIYKEVDAQGNVHFSDKSSQQGQSVSIKINNVFSASKKTQAEKKIQPTQKQKTKIIDYQTNIISPHNDISIRSNNGQLNVQVKISPNLLSTHRLQFFMDGIKIGKQQHASIFTLQGVDRGTHLLQVHLIDKEKQIISKSPIVRVHLYAPILKDKKC